MSRFERRGLPFRDVFDSTFDEILVMRPLSLHESQQLLAKRVVGMPFIFSALCHVISGGLPRDLVRTARRLVEAQRRLEGVRGLHSLTAALMDEELFGKVEATRYAARAAELPEPLLARFVEWLDDLARARGESSSLDAFCAAVPQLASVTLAANGLDERGQAARSTVLRMGVELTAYAYFTATVLTFFQDSLDESHVARAADGRQAGPQLEALAQARGAFAVNAHSAWLACSGFRAATGMTTVDLSAAALT